MTNAELLTLARGYRAQLLQCNADKASLELDATGQAPGTEPEKPAEARPWWQLWR